MSRRTALEKKGKGGKTPDGIYHFHEENVVVAYRRTLREDWV